MLPDNLENRQSLFSIIDSFERKSRYAALDKSKNLSGNTASYKVFGVSVPLRKMCIESCVNSFRLFPLPILIENSIRTLKNAKKNMNLLHLFLAENMKKNNQLL